MVSVDVKHHVYLHTYFHIVAKFNTLKTLDSESDTFYKVPAFILAFLVVRYLVASTVADKKENLVVIYFLANRQKGKPCS